MILKIDHVYSNEDIEEIFNTKFGQRPKGINPRNGSDRNYILLFSREDGPYNNRIDDNILFYIGEGKDKLKDQRMDRGNKRLADSKRENRVVYGFIQEENSKNWIYIGILVLKNYLEIENEHGSKIFEFQLKIMGINSYDEIKLETEKLKLLTSEKPILTEDRSLSSVSKRKSRSYAFSRIIRKSFDYKCAVCSKKMKNKDGFYEVEAAHIFPKSDNGSDDIRNGLSLCRFHHWAFDGGLFSIKNDFTIIIDEQIKNDENYEFIYVFEGKKIILPKNGLRPDPLFLSKHREKYGYDDFY